MSEPTYQIKSFRASNVLRLRVVEITPNGPVVTIAGKNGQGKSSVLDSIMMAIEGPRAMPAKPVREGAQRAEIRLDLGGIIVERIITPAGDRVEVKTPDGATFKRPQTMLDELYSAISFDPLDFARQAASDQAETLRRVMGIDLSEVDAREERAFDERTAANRDLKALRARLQAAAFYPDAPAEEVSIDALTTELGRRMDAEEEHRLISAATASKRTQLSAAVTALKHAQEALERAQRELREREAAAADRQRELENAEGQLKAATAALEPSQEIRTKLNGVQATNRAVAANAAHGKLAADVTAKEADVAVLTEAIDAARAERAAAIAAASFPVKGLSIANGAVTLDGIPFAQASTAQKIRVSLEVGIALNPRLRVMLIRDGSLLDEDGLQLIAQIATERAFQIWMEDARSTDPTAVVLEDGHVRGVDPPAEEPADAPPAIEDVRPDAGSPSPTPPPAPRPSPAAPAGSDLFSRTASGANVRTIAPPPPAPAPRKGKR
jgi:hypothetical protein